MNEKDIENLKDLHFTITKKIKELSKEDRKLLEKHFEKMNREALK